MSLGLGFPYTFRVLSRGPGPRLWGKRGVLSVSLRVVEGLETYRASRSPLTTSVDEGELSRHDLQ